MIHPFTTYVTAAVAIRLSLSELINVLLTDPVNGLNKSEADRRLKLYGHNQLNEIRSNPMWLAYLYQFKQPMILLLLISALISLLFHQFDDAISITCAVIIVVTVAFIQEYRSEKALSSLSKLLPAYTKCIRQQMISIPSMNLVPGDLICLEAGDRVPADTKLVEANELLLDESSFTGEHECVSKFVVDNDKSSILFAGSCVRHGNCKGIVVATGEYSEFGAVLKLMRDETPPETPLQSAMDYLSRQISAISLFIIVAIVSIGYLFCGYQFREILSIGVSLAVAAIPEGLPIVVTVTLALGVLRMARKKTIVRQIQSVETMGRVDTICFDKTGTLTCNQMTLHSILSFNENDVHVWTHSASLEAYDKSIDNVVMASLLCNNAEMYCSNGSQQWEFRGQPTEGALWIAATTYFPEVLNDIKSWTRVKEWPFSSEKRWMAVEVSANKPTGQRHGLSSKIIMKGALEVVLENCIEPNVPPKFLVASNMRNLRVLAVAEGDTFQNLRLIGLIGMFDKIRQSAKSMICRIQSLHKITPMIITGDSEEATKYIANELSLNANLTCSGADAERRVQNKNWR
ncbi:hypothetical protein GJ496_001488 [Pomphorhynchus laevis]|nr:hypothetical protein GJ496_001488 [Pomphorhynchus laevis]